MPGSYRALDSRILTDGILVSKIWYVKHLLSSLSAARSYIQEYQAITRLAPDNKSENGRGFLIVVFMLFHDSYPIFYTSGNNREIDTD